MSILKGEKITSARGVAMTALFVTVAIGLSVSFKLAVSIHQKSTDNITVIYSSENIKTEQTLDLAEFELNQIKQQATFKIPLQSGITYILMFLELLISVAYVVVFFLTAKIFHRVDKGDPFSQKNQAHLHIISWIFIGHAFYTHLRDYLVTEIISNKFTDEIRIVEVAGFDPFVLIGLGMIISAFAYIFKEGNRIYEEQKLTV